MPLLRIAALCLCMLCMMNARAQKPAVVQPRPSQSSDTIRVVDIKNANRFDFKTIDSATQLQILVGNVIIHQGKTKFKCDSLIWNERTNFMEAFGNVHINDADSVNIYSSYMKYEGNKKLATFKNKVRLTDGNSTLYTDEMDYDMNGKVGTYRNGGRIESKQTTLYSKQGFYYADIKDVYFIGDVKMSDPEVALASDSLLYNTTSEVATFIAPTTIKSGNSISNVRSGYYDLKTKKAVFAGRSIVRDSTSTMIADKMVMDDKTGFGEANGNVQFKDTAQGILLFSNRVFFNKTKKNFLATEKPVLVVVREADSVYVAADTIYSGLMKDLAQFKGSYLQEFDTITSTKVVNVDSLLKNDGTTIIKKDSIPVSPVIQPVTKDSITVQKKPETVIVAKDTLVNNNRPVQKEDRRNKFNQPSADSTAKPMIPARDSATVVIKDTINKRTEFPPRSKAETDTLRFITAFRNVRIFNDSLQAVADSMFYSGIDSAFQLYYDPIAWAKGSQVTGDTIFLYTKNKKPARLFVFENAMLVQNVREKAGFFNQIKGRTINGYFKEGDIDFVKAKGSAQSIYYVQDADSAYVGMNRTSADMIDMFFENKEAKKVKFTSSVKGVTYPIRQLPEDQKKLDSFKWLEQRRPKNKLELFL
ncbi:MAG: LPS export ABC transporter periplasmic protein LptC [Chitinophagaceae bacterium]|nr:LPS export ABC transporter periplasmic protein LptC [Chitinophagaceae bacterium]